MRGNQKGPQSETAVTDQNTLAGLRKVAERGSIWLVQEPTWQGRSAESAARGRRRVAVSRSYQMLKCLRAAH